MRWIVIAFVCLILSAPVAYAADCGYMQFIEGFEKNNDIEHHGYYLQPNHCFSVIIPKGVTGRTSSEAASQHGFGALISHPDGDSYLLVQGDYGAWLDDPDDETPRSLEKVVRHHLSWLGQDGVTTIRKTARKALLGPLPAVRSVAFYKCPQSRLAFVQDSIFAIDSSGSVYEVTLFATDKNHVSDSVVLEKVAKSWKVEKTKCDELSRDRPFSR